MRAYPEYKDLIELFNINNVEFMIVGGQALPYHDTPNYNKDVDVLIKPDSANAKRIIKAFKEFLFHSAYLTEADFDKPKHVVKLGRPPKRFDILTSLAGVPWEEAFLGRVSGNFWDIPVQYIGHKQLIASKKATNRQKKSADKIFELYFYLSWQWSNFIRFKLRAEDIIRRFLGIRPRNCVLDMGPYLDQAFVKVVEQAKDHEKYSSEDDCRFAVDCDFVYISDTCRLERGWECPECPSRQAIREKIKQDSASDPRL